MRKKVGIVTFWTTQNNYGSLLQCYALQKVIKGLGLHPFLIKYKETEKQPSLLDKIKRWFQVMNSVSELKYALERRQKKMRVEPSREFSSFIDKYIDSTSISYTLEMLNISAPEADYYVTGSDQVWKKYDEGYFLNWVNDEIGKFSYAASFGAANLPANYLEKIKNVLPRFSAVTLREESGVEMCRKMGFDASLMPDPTLLLAADDYRDALYGNINKNILPRHPYIFVYLLKDKPSISVQPIQQFAKDNNLEIVYVISNNNLKGDCFLNLPEKYPTIPEWLYLLDNASYVLTNSFHGTLFSVIFNKQLGIYAMEENGVPNVRINSFLNRVGLEYRILQNETTLDQILEPTSFDSVNMILLDQRRSVYAILNKWFDI